jgi:hypothetical protein
VVSPLLMTFGKKDPPLSISRYIHVAIAIQLLTRTSRKRKTFNHEGARRKTLKAHPLPASCKGVALSLSKETRRFTTKPKVLFVLLCALRALGGKALQPVVKDRQSFVDVNAIRGKKLAYSPLRPTQARHQRKLLNQPQLQCHCHCFGAAAHAQFGQNIANILFHGR